MNDFLNQVYLKNTTEDYLISLGIIVVGIVLLRVFRKIVLRKLKKIAARTQREFDDVLIEGLEKFGLPLLNVLLIYYALHYLQFSEKVTRVIEGALTVAFTFFFVKLILRIIRLALEGFVLKQENGEEKLKQIRGINVVIAIVVWAIGVVFLLDNLGYNITAIITGLGIGGVAIALASQNILGDLFNYFVIFFDRPFEIGDFVIVDDKKGTVEYIGIKSTRVKSLSGEQLIFSNSDLTSARIHNYKRMERRRIVFTIGVIYETPAEKLKKIPTIIKEAIESQSSTTFDRSHFLSFGDFSLNFETVYFVESAEYNHYMDIQQTINLRLFDEFEKEGIAFAYPTQTVYEHRLSSK